MLGLCPCGGLGGLGDCQFLERESSMEEVEAMRVVEHMRNSIIKTRHLSLTNNYVL